MGGGGSGMRGRWGGKGWSVEKVLGEGGEGRGEGGNDGKGEGWWWGDGGSVRGEWGMNGDVWRGGGERVGGGV